MVDRSLFYLAATFTVFALTSAPAAAQNTLSGTLNAALELTSSCVISGDDATSGANFGTLDFGSHPSTFVGTLTTQATGGAGGPGLTQILCSPDVTSVAVSVSGGNHAGLGVGTGPGGRALAQGTTYIAYDMYADDTFATPYPTNGTAVPVPVPSPGSAFELPVYGRLQKTTATALPAGIYTDALTVSIEF